MNYAPAAALHLTSYALRPYGTKNGKTTRNLAVHFAKRTAKLANFHKERFTSFNRVYPYVRKAICYKFGVKEQVFKKVNRDSARLICLVIDSICAHFILSK